MPYTADPRVLFAAERTLLAWQRSAIALMGFGFVVERFGLFFPGPLPSLLWLLSCAYCGRASRQFNNNDGCRLRQAKPCSTSLCTYPRRLSPPEYSPTVAARALCKGVRA
jgi:hypothetical protein